MTFDFTHNFFIQMGIYQLLPLGFLKFLLITFIFIYMYIYVIYIEYFSVATISDITNKLEILKQSLFFAPPTHLSFRVSVILSHSLLNLCSLCVTI